MSIFLSVCSHDYTVSCILQLYYFLAWPLVHWQTAAQFLKCMLHAREVPSSSIILEGQNLCFFYSLSIYYVIRTLAFYWANYLGRQRYLFFHYLHELSHATPENTGTVRYLKGLEISQGHILVIWSSLRKWLDYFLQLCTEIKASGWNLIKNNRQQVTVYSKPNHWQG